MTCGSAEVADDADEEAGEGGLEVLRPARKGFAGAGGDSRWLAKSDGGEAAKDAEDCVGDGARAGREVVTGMRKSGSVPRNQRTTTTLETAERTTEPRMPALQRPMTSSMTKRTAEMGALKAAARPAAAPTGEAGGVFRARVEAAAEGEAMVAPICSDGSSGPRECPEPMARAAEEEFADGGAEWECIR